MPKVNVPLFVKNMGHRIVSYILNISEEDAVNVLNSNLELKEDKAQILQQFIKICRQLRMQGIDQGDVDFAVFHSLPNIFVSDKHIFNVWHEQMGGTVNVYKSNDLIVQIINRVASKLYPLFLIKVTNKPSFYNKMHHNISSTIYQLPEYKELCEELMKDDVISSVFDQIGTNECETWGSYTTSTGHGGGVQLATLPATLVVNSFELMRMRGQLSLKAFSNAAESTVDTIRRCISGDVVNVPVFLGFNNISLDDVGEIKTEWGTLRPVSEGISELAPNNTSITNIDGKQYKLGFVLESEYPYQINFGDDGKKNIWPKELDSARNRLSEITENVSLCFSLACDRTPPVGMSLAWTMIFDPISQGTNLSWISEPRSPVNFHILADSEGIIDWCKNLKEVEDTTIRLAIRRILSAINQRQDPIDGFVDTIIAWENLFGGNAELSFRISVSIAKLLGETDEQRNNLQKFVNEHYNIRSKLVHGVKELTHEQAVDCRDRCLDIALKAVRKLYLERVELIEDMNSTNRSKILALS
ncbi:hypothetical protein RV040_000795 [Vibrio alginolyticus]|nr:hypothetical protein [Vibrio alginolyticus]